MDQSARTHEAGFRGYVEYRPRKAIVLFRLSRVSQHLDLCVRCRIMQTDRMVVGHAENDRIAREHRPNGHLTGGRAKARRRQRHTHEADVIVGARSG